MQTYREHKITRATPGSLFEAGLLRFEEDDLVYAATARCRCSAGLAFVQGEWSMRAWWCSALLTDGLDGCHATSDDGHDAEKSFYLASDAIECEYLPGLPDDGTIIRTTLTGETTRPNAPTTAYTITAGGKAPVTHHVESIAKDALFDAAYREGTVSLSVRCAVVNERPIRTSSTPTEPSWEASRARDASQVSSEQTQRFSSKGKPRDI